MGVSGYCKEDVVGNVVLTKNTKAHLCPLAVMASGRLLPICSGPVICCPLSALVLTKVGSVLVVSAPASLPGFRELLNSNSSCNVGLACGIRPSPSKLTRTFVLNKRFVNSSTYTVILKSGVFCNGNFKGTLHTSIRGTRGGNQTAMFNCCIRSPRHFNIITFSRGNGTVSVRRGPGRPGDGCTIAKLCFCPGKMSTETDSIGPSTHKRLRVATLGRVCLGSRVLSIRFLNQNCT